MTQAVQHADSMTVRVPDDVKAAVAGAARSRGMKPAEYHRQALLTALRLDGVEVAAIAPRDAGSLYNVRADGHRCWAYVVGDHVKAMAYHQAKPEASETALRGGAWLPVEHEDSEPFDISKHWRLPPIDRVEADRVVRVFQVVPKHWENA